MNEPSSQTKKNVLALSKFFGAKEVAEYLGLPVKLVLGIIGAPKPEPKPKPKPEPKFAPHHYINGWISTAEEEKKTWEHCQQVHEWFNKKYGGNKW